MSAIARVLVDTGLAHLDREFDYLIPENLDASAQPGVRVKVRFAGVMREGWLVERVDSSEHRLAPLGGVVSPESVLAPEIRALAEVVARRWAGSSTDVLRTAIPPRQARIEKEVFAPADRPAPHSLSIGAEYPGLAEFLERLDRAPRASWVWLPGRAPFADLADLVRSVDGGVLVVVPDARDVHRLAVLLQPELGASLAILTGDLPPAQRYRAFLRIRRGSASFVIGTRSAIFAPLHGLRLIVVVDDGDESHEEPHAPGWNTRGVASLRAHAENVALLIAGHSVSVESQVLVEQGWLGEINPEVEALKSAMPRVSIDADADGSRIPTRTWQVIRRGLQRGSVLVCAAFGGYQPTLVCQQCGSAAECQCGGRLASLTAGQKVCRLCGSDGDGWRCPHCHCIELRASSVGALRLVEELGRAHPGVQVESSTADRVVPDHFAARGDEARIVISTTGVEPVATGGYAAVVILNADFALARSDIRVEDEARRRWFNALALARAGAEVSIVGSANQPSLQAVLAWSPRRGAAREAGERERLHLPPIWQFVTIESADVHPWRAMLEEHGVEVLGPMLSDHGQRLVARAPRGVLALAELVREFAVVRSSRKEAGARVRVDPLSFDAR